MTQRNKIGKIRKMREKKYIAYFLKLVQCTRHPNLFSGKTAMYWLCILDRIRTSGFNCFYFSLQIILWFHWQFVSFKAEKNLVFSHKHMSVLYFMITIDKNLNIDINSHW